jgi:hypothetical protein
MSIGSKRHAKSVVVDDGRIVFVGSDAEAMKLKAEDDLHAAFQLTLAQPMNMPVTLSPLP